jgi:hypothetical protein
MNQLVIIGNGFDLAHGLKTSYKDFMLWYLNKRLAALDAEKKYEDGLCSFEINTSSSLMQDGPINSIDGYFRLLSKWSNWLIKKEDNHYFKELLKRNLISAWVDIELFYYNELTKILDNYKRQQSEQKRINGLDNLNIFIQTITTLLEEYLTGIYTESELVAYDVIGNKLRSRLESNNLLFLNFNYTNTIQQYIDTSFPPTTKCTYIHGKLGCRENPIIFGYGDEIDAKYKLIEDTGIDEFLHYIKSFWYLKTNNYRETINFLESGPYEVSIAGHSCGLSDRVLLSSIFTHDYCKSIDIWYHKKPDGTDDYTQKLYAISRQFPLQFKGDMRRKIIPFNHSVPLVAK